MKTSLIIVESPAKCDKIQEYLGPGYRCIASYGHIRELPSLKNIDIKNNFTPSYEITKKKQVDILKQEIKKASEIILATDDDREGEAIAWHLCDVFKLDVTKTKRIVFHEITKDALINALKTPRKVNMNLVKAQQSRQILDVLVGFKVSPMLWKLVSNSKKDAELSAGRCQTPALKLVYENQREIDNAKVDLIYNPIGLFTNLSIKFELYPKDKINNDDDMIAFLKESISFKHIFNCNEPSKIKRCPPDPFNTSKLQQASSNEFSYSPKETMRICQNLYEAGHITYMRTDSTKFCKEFIDKVSKFIERTYEKKYFNSSLELDELTDTAHEAIRPTDISLQELDDNFDSKHNKVYKLIWKNSLQSCMSEATGSSITATILAPLNYKYKYSTEFFDFAGWKILDKGFSLENNKYTYLKTIKPDSVIEYKSIMSNLSIKGSKSHYTEARLVQLLDEKGIGRPSTYSSIVDKIQTRGYVKKEDVVGKKMECTDFTINNSLNEIVQSKREILVGNEKSKLVIQPLGIIVMEFLEKNFNSIFNYDYTKNMEDSLDKISCGEMEWVEICDLCNKELDLLLDEVKSTNKIEMTIDDNNTYIIGKYGPVIKCVDDKEGVSFKPVKKDVDIHKLQNGEYSIDEIVKKDDDNNIILGKYDDHDLIIHKGKYGLYVTWGEKSRHLKELGNKPIENVLFEDVIEILDKGNNIIREINETLSIRKSKRGDYIFFKTTRMKKPQFFEIKSFLSETNLDYKTCDINVLKSWIDKKINAP